MSYHDRQQGHAHDAHDRATADLFATYANSDRAHTVSGRTRFVSTSGSDLNSGLNSRSQAHRSQRRHRFSAAGGDIVCSAPETTLNWSL
jgi:hypothetical protein